MPLIFHITVLGGSVLMLIWLSRGPFFVPTKRRHVERVVASLGLKPDERAIDLGSGDGRLVIAMAKSGAQVCGVEHNPLLVWRARRNIARAGFAGRASVSRGDFWRIDLSGFDAVTIYGIPYIMARLEKKLQQELPAGARVASYSFKLPNWRPVSTEGGVYLYKKE